MTDAVRRRDATCRTLPFDECLSSGRDVPNLAIADFLRGPRQVKIIPQWILATVAARQTTGFKVQKINLIGAVCIMVSAAAFAVYNYVKTPLPEEGPCRRDEERGRSEGRDCADTAASEEKPLLLLRDADDWGAPYMRKTYDALRGEATEEIVGRVVADPVVELNVPILTRNSSSCASAVSE